MVENQRQNHFFCFCQSRAYSKHNTSDKLKKWEQIQKRSEIWTLKSGLTRVQDWNSPNSTITAFTSSRAFQRKSASQGRWWQNFKVSEYHPRYPRKVWFSDEKFKNDI